MTKTQFCTLLSRLDCNLRHNNVYMFRYLTRTTTTNKTTRTRTQTYTFRTLGDHKLSVSVEDACNMVRLGIFSGGMAANPFVHDELLVRYTSFSGLPERLYMTQLGEHMLVVLNNNMYIDTYPELLQFSGRNWLPIAECLTDIFQKDGLRHLNNRFNLTHYIVNHIRETDLTEQYIVPNTRVGWCAERKRP